MVVVAETTTTTRKKLPGGPNKGLEYPRSPATGIRTQIATAFPLYLPRFLLLVNSYLFYSILESLLERGATPVYLLTLFMVFL